MSNVEHEHGPGCDCPDCGNPRSMDFLDKYLTVWIFGAMAIGVGFGYVAPAVTHTVGHKYVNTLAGNTLSKRPFPVERAIHGGLTCVRQYQPIQDLHLVELGLILMMYPPLAKVNYGQLPTVFRNVKVLGLGLVQNWLIGPTLMFGLAVVFFSGLVPGLPVRPEFFLGLARCIAMVLVWNELAEGSSEYAAGLVAFNSVFQILTYGVYVWFFALVVPDLVGLEAVASGIGQFGITPMQVFEAIAVFLGVPFAAGILSRYVGTRTKGAEWYEGTFEPAISPSAPVSSDAVARRRERRWQLPGVGHGLHR